MRMAALLAAITGGCDETSRQSPRPVAPPARDPSVAGYRVVSSGPVGSVSGTVRWRGPVPPAAEVAVPPHAQSACGTTRSVPSVRVGPSGGVLGAVISLEGIREGRLPPGGEVRVAFAQCDLTPAVSAMPVGATLRFVNDDALLHNLRVVQGGRSWLDLGLAERGGTIDAAPAVGVHRIVDDAAHPWIEGWLVVTEHPYVVVTDANGRFALPRVPVGSYQIRLWHPGILTGGPTSSGRPARSAPIIMSRPLSVSDGDDSSADFELDAESVEAAGR